MTIVLYTKPEPEEQKVPRKLIPEPHGPKPTPEVEVGPPEPKELSQEPAVPKPKVAKAPEFKPVTKTPEVPEPRGIVEESFLFFC